MAYSLICFPSRVTLSLPLSCCNNFLYSSSAFLRSISSLSVTSSGSIYILPSLPSTTAIFPSNSLSSGISVPTSAGIPIVLASMAVCEFIEPCTVTNASTLSLSICTVSDGARSSAIIMHACFADILSLPPPESIVSTLSDISFTSAALAFMYSSSIDANICAKLSSVTATAYSELTFCVLIIFSTDSL